MIEVKEKSRIVLDSSIKQNIHITALGNNIVKQTIQGNQQKTKINLFDIMRVKKNCLTKCFLNGIKDC